jgi:reactive intermediate/imine deaminase
MKKILLLAALLAAGAGGAQEPVPLSKLPFSAARKAGNTLYVSGQVARDAEGKDVKESVEAETRQVMENLGRILAEHGYSFDDVVSATVYLADIEDYHAMNKVYASYFKNAFPARACVGGVELVFGFKVEISCIAYKDQLEEGEKVIPIQK